MSAPIPAPHSPFHRRRTRRPGPIRRAFRAAAKRVILEALDPHVWNALAIVALTALAAMPAESVAAHPFWRAWVPVLAAAGVALRSYQRGGRSEEPEVKS